jgi:streptomycin 6-kinase
VTLHAVPAGVADGLRSWFGADGERWLADAHGVAGLSMERWSLRADGPPYDGATQAYVLPVRRADGTAAVLKHVYLDVESRAEPTALRLFDGDGAVRLLEYDPRTGVMLLERAEPGTTLLESRLDGEDDRAAARRMVDTACALYRRLWRAPEALPTDFPELPHSDVLLSTWERRYGEPDAELLEKARPDWISRWRDMCALLREPAETGVANRDTHLSNIVAGRDGEWLLIDPKPYWGDRAFDGGFFLFKQQFHGPLGGADLMSRVADGLGVDRERLRAWAVLRTSDFVYEASTPDEARQYHGVVEALQGA